MLTKLGLQGQCSPCDHGRQRSHYKQLPRSVPLSWDVGGSCGHKKGEFAASLTPTVQKSFPVPQIIRLA